MQSGQSHLISRCLTLVVQSVGTVELQKVHLYSRAVLRLQPGQVLAQASARGRCTSAPGAGARARRREPRRACAGLRGADQPAQTAGARCRRRPCPRPHPGPACSRLVHAHCPHVCSALASADDPHAAVRTAPFEALAAPGNLLQGKNKNQT